MPVTPTYPGVYIEEVPSGVRTIAGVATSIAAFVDYFRRGPMNQAVQIFSFADFEREFGGLDAKSEASYAIQQFYLNGGGEAWVVRVASGTPAAASVVLNSAPAGSSFTVRAASAGTWGDRLRIAVDHGTGTGRFNLTISELGAGDAVIRQESFRGLSMTRSDPNFVEKVVNGGSRLITVPDPPSVTGNNPPAATGTVSTPVALVGLPLPVSTTDRRVQVSFTGAEGANNVQANLGMTAISSLDEAAGRLQAAIRNARPASRSWAEATVRVVPATTAEQGHLQVTAGPSTPDAIVTFANDSLTDTTATTLGLTGAAANVAQYRVGAFGAPANVGSQGAGIAGNDGTPPDATALIGSQAATPPTGIYALDKVPLFNVLCLPRIAKVSGTDAFPTSGGGEVDSVITAATTYCDARRAFVILDTPSNVNTVPQIKAWLSGKPRHKNVAFYFPRVQIADPLDEFRPRSVGASGTIAGLYARIDAARGVWKAPAGTEAVLRGVQKLDYEMTDPENGTLNPLAINCLRTFPVYGNVSWGARTLDGSDQQASEWKYIPVRRLALFLEESLYRGTQWVVFEPNDEPLWSQIRLNVGAFMHNLFRQGAFQGRSPREAYLVKCDRETTTQNDIDRGIVNIVVGFAPLKPAEFVILKIQQLAGQIET